MLEKSVSVDGLSVNYKIAGEGRPLLILHGWGSSSDSWREVQKMLVERGYQVIVPDLPGFGKTQAPSPPRSPKRSRGGEDGQGIWGIEEYAEFVKKFADLLTFKVNKSGKFVLVGHSFGGQIAIHFAVQHPEKVEKLVLIAAAGVRRTPGVFKKFVMGVAKLVSFLLYLVPFRDLRNNVKNAMYMLIRKRDYARAQGIMREVFKKVITQDLTIKFPKISMPTLLIWGEKDEMTPLQDAYLMDELIPNSRLEIIEGGKHTLNFQVPEKLANLILTFLEK